MALSGKIKNRALSTYSKPISSYGIVNLKMFDTVYFRKDQTDSTANAGMNYFTIEKL